MLVDSLLKLMTAQAAQALVIRTGAPPALQRGGTTSPLSMPSLDQETVAIILGEVASPDQRAQLSESETLETVYVSSVDAKSYAVIIDRDASGLRITFRPAGGPRVAISQTQAVKAPARPTEAPVPPHAESPSSIVDGNARPVALAEDLAAILARADHERASDVLLSSGRAPRMRVAGELIEWPDTLAHARLAAFVQEVLTPQQRRELDDRGSADTALALPYGDRPRRWRINAFRQQDGLALALRPIRSEAAALRDLGLPDDLYELVAHRTGLVLLTGTAGSGKSTSMAALIEHVNRRSAKHIITLEDPIEFEFASQRSLIHQREVGRHVSDFASGLRAALRESPDIIMLGEMRDRETISAALTAAETGHLVLATLHSGSAAMAIDRIVDAYPEHQQAQVRAQLASVLRAVITQVLLPSPRPPGRVPAYEKLVVNTAVAVKIRDLRGHQIQSEIQKGRSEGMVSFELSLARLVRTGRLTMELALGCVADRQLFNDLLRQA